ncbi:GNAT family N-acetyltransferase [Rhodobacterales bacterium FZCC0188]|nr:GNAT family N-acetyltransferase [Rhodobacterales bacterium FZCC0188]
MYKAACSRYDSTSEMSQVEYFSLMKHLKSFNNACVFGAFVDEELVAYIIAIPSGDRLFGYFGCFDPKYSNSYPMWSLYFNICKFAFLEGFSVFDRGVQPLKHTTNIDEFLLRIGYRMESCRSIYYAMPLLSFGFWFVSLLEIFGIKSFLGILLSDIKIIKKVINNE